MPYLKRTVHAGSMVYIKKYYSSRYGKKNNGVKAAKANPSSQKMQEINARNAVEKLTWLINSNFVDGDFHVVLTYQGNSPTPEEAAEILRKYLRKIRTEYRKQNLELKYVWITEFKNTRIHHHILLNNSDAAVLSNLWKHGSCHFTPLYTTGDYSKLAEYFVKETQKTYKDSVISGKRWNVSKNLIKPKIEKEVVDAESWTNYPRAVKGYYIPKDTIEMDVDEFGYPYQKYTMIKIPEKKGRTKVDKRWRDNGALNR